MWSRLRIGVLSRLTEAVHFTLLRGVQSFSNHSRTVWFLRHEGVRPPGMGFTRAIASRFMSRSMVAYRLWSLGWRVRATG